MVILIYYIYYTSQARLAWLCVLFCLDICECDCDRTVAFTWPSAVCTLRDSVNGLLVFFPGQELLGLEGS